MRGDWSARIITLRSRRGLVRRRGISRSWFGGIRRVWGVRLRVVRGRMVCLQSYLFILRILRGRGRDRWGWMQDGRIECGGLVFGLICGGVVERRNWRSGWRKRCEISSWQVQQIHQVSTSYANTTHLVTSSETRISSSKIMSWSKIRGRRLIRLRVESRVRPGEMVLGWPGCWDWRSFWEPGWCYKLEVRCVRGDLIPFCRVAFSCVYFERSLSIWAI